MDSSITFGSLEPNFITAEVVIVTVTIISVLIYVNKKDARIKKHLSAFPGPTAYPFFGSCLSFLRPPTEYVDLLKSWFREHNEKSMVIWIGQVPFILVGEASVAEKVLSSYTYVNKSWNYDLLSKWLGLGLLTAKDKKWHSRRKLLTPAFHFKILEEFVEVFNEQANVLVSNLTNKHADGKSFDMYPFITRCALDIICETAMGIKVNAQSVDDDIQYVTAVYAYPKLILKKFFSPWFLNKYIWKISGYNKQEDSFISTLHKFTSKIIQDRKKERINSPVEEKSSDKQDDFGLKRRKAFLDLLLDFAQVDESLTDNEIREEVDTFMFEGHDTTAANLIWTILLLSLHPHHQSKIQAEVDEVLGHDKERPVFPADIAKMKYLECCVKESLRLYPSVPCFFREASEDLDLGDSKIIPKGSSIGIGAFLLHTNSEYFPDPETFNPDRFTYENSIGRSPYAYVPFSAGPRNCIGQKFALMEEKIILARLVQNFDIHSTVSSRQEVKSIPDIILRPAEGVFVKLTKRK